jgi:hypothetical protein
VKVKRIIELHLQNKRVEIFVEHTYWVCLDLSCFVLFWFGLHNNVENVFLNDDLFRNIAFRKKSQLEWVFLLYKTFFHFKSRYKIFLQSLQLQKKNSHSLQPREIPCLRSLGPTKIPSYIRQIFYREKIRVCILYLLFLWLGLKNIFKFPLDNFHLQQPSIS